jgi:uncharacterized protein (DUF2147 family)
VRTLAAGAAALFISLHAHAQSVEGRWRTFNERTGQAEGIVRVFEVSGEVRGTVERVFSPPAPSANPLCESCRGALKDQPVVGMTILSGVRRTGDGFSSGEILDPDNGQVYRCNIRLMEDGRMLEVRGYIGVPLFGRTQVWRRE